MGSSNSTMARQLAYAASAFEHQRTGHAPRSVSVVLNKETLVITLQGALSPAEKALAKTPAGAAQMQEYHRQLFADSADALLQEIKRITGVEVREATAEVETITGAVMQMFASGTVVQVFLLANSVPAGTWLPRSRNGPAMEDSPMTTWQVSAIVAAGCFLALAGMVLLWRRMPVYRWYCSRCKKIVSAGRLRPGRCTCGTNLLVAYFCRACASWNTAPKSSWHCDDCSSRNVVLGVEYHIVQSLWRRRNQNV